MWNPCGNVVVFCLRVDEGGRKEERALMVVGGDGESVVSEGT